MQRIMFKSKIHRARVTDANLYYEGSMTIDPEMMEAADFLPYEKISVVNVNNGERFETYVIPGTRGKREFCLNGAAARRAAIGDEVIIIAYANMEEHEARTYSPTVVLLGKDNEIVSVSNSVEAGTLVSPN